jgi:pimeloyl-ACP methyl ester carboxylesterase
MAVAGFVLVVIDSSLGSLGRFVGIALAALAAVVLAYLNRRRDRRRDRRWDVTAALVVGSLATPIAAAYGGARLAEGGWLTGAIGLIAALAALGVLIYGATLAVRALPGWWRLMALPVALVLLQFVLLPVAAGTFGAHATRMPLTTPAPADATAVAFITADGVELHGWYTAGTNGAAVVLLPGASGHRSNTVEHAAVLASNGYGVLAIDSRGNGDSGGIGNMWGWDGTTDIGAAIDWLGTQPAIDSQRIGVVGLSMGGEQALTAAAVDARIQAVVSEGVQGRMPADTWFIGGSPTSDIERAVNTITWLVADLWTEASPPAPLREVADTIDQTPVLVIAADAPDERAVSGDLAQRSPTIQVWQTTGIGHTQALALAPAEWEAHVIAFLDGALAPR